MLEQHTPDWGEILRFRVSEADRRSWVVNGGSPLGRHKGSLVAKLDMSGNVVFIELFASRRGTRLSL